MIKNFKVSVAVSLDNKSYNFIDGSKFDIEDKPEIGRVYVKSKKTGEVVWIPHANIPSVTLVKNAEEVKKETKIKK